MSKRRLSPQNMTAIAIAAIGVLGSVVAAYFAYRGSTAPIELVINATQTAEGKSIPSAEPPTPTTVPTQTPVPTATITPTDTQTPTPIEIEMPIVIADTNILVGWIPDFDFSRGDSAKNGMDTDKVAIKLSYDVGENGYVTMTRSVNAKTMSDVTGIRFTYMGDGAPNSIEFKLILRYSGDAGDTTYGKLWVRATDTGGEWLTFEVPYGDMECWWPEDNCNAHGDLLDPAMVDRLDFAISNKAGDEAGSGWVMFKDVVGIRP